MSCFTILPSELETPLFLVRIMIPCMGNEGKHLVDGTIVQQTQTPQLGNGAMTFPRLKVP